MKEIEMFAFMFDSGRLESSFYGDVVFNAMLNGKEITENKTPIIVYLGDIAMYKKFIDIEPYIINDDFCTINFDELCKDKHFRDYPFCWVIENLEHEIASTIDRRLKRELKGYVGLSRIDLSSTDERKQFWRELSKEFTIYGDNIVYFQDPDLTDVFCYLESTNNLGFKVQYDKYAKFEDSFYAYTEYKSDNSTNFEKVDRDLMELNFKLCRELQIAGSLIWRSINDIDKVNFHSFDIFNDKDDKNKRDISYLLEYSFFTLYHASQGIERLQKIIVELICKKHHLKVQEKQKVFEILYSHNHHALNDWIKNKETVSLNSNCEIIFTLLQKFYNKLRYARFLDDKNMKYLSPEFILLQDLCKEKAENLDYIIKKNFGKHMGHISHIYYELVRNLCFDLNIFAYELDSSSSATIVFFQDNKNLYGELEKRKQAKKELVYWLIKNTKTNKKYELLELEPLKFDDAMIEYFLFELITNPEDGSNLFNEFDFLYDELCGEDKQAWTEREKTIKTVVANPYCFIDEED